MLVVTKENHMVTIEDGHAEIFRLSPYDRLGSGQVKNLHLVTEVTLPPDVVEAVDNEIEEEVIRVGNVEEAAARVELEEAAARALVAEYKGQI